MAYKKLANLAMQSPPKNEKVWNNSTGRRCALDGVYQASLANYSVRISLVDSQGDEGVDVKISIINEEGSDSRIVLGC